MNLSNLFVRQQNFEEALARPSAGHRTAPAVCRSIRGGHRATSRSKSGSMTPLALAGSGEIEARIGQSAQQSRHRAGRSGRRRRRHRALSPVPGNSPGECRWPLQPGDCADQASPARCRGGIVRCGIGLESRLWRGTSQSHSGAAADGAFARGLPSTSGGFARAIFRRMHTRWKIWDSAPLAGRPHDCALCRARVRRDFDPVHSLCANNPATGCPRCAGVSPRSCTRCWLARRALMHSLCPPRTLPTATCPRPITVCRC